MIYWDSSAVVPLLVEEPNTPRVRALLRREEPMIVAWTTSIECLSALMRLQRMGGLTVAAVEVARARLHQLTPTWHELVPNEATRGHAGRLLLRHPLRAADAFQLGAAMTWARGQPSGHRFATLDERLASAARGEGFALPLQSA